MFSFHKSKIFRSLGGCCICKAKSSSSRFTDSKRYEVYFAKCFSLEEHRRGEICNACVLLVKRFAKLPPGSSKNWSHVVDARSGPGVKSIYRAKKQSKVEDNVARSGVETNESPDKFKRKHERKRKLIPPTDKDVRKRHPSIDISPFLDMSFWKREKICCGTIFRAPNGEVAVDVRYINPCENCNKLKNPATSKASLADPLKIVANNDDLKAEVTPKTSLPKSASYDSDQSHSVLSCFANLTYLTNEA